MKKLFTGLMALAIAALVGTTQIAPALANNLKILTLAPSANRTASLTGTAVNTTRKYNSVTQSYESFGDKALVFLNCNAAASGTLDIVVYGAYAAAGVYTPLTPSAAWTQVTTAASQQTRTYLGPIPPFLKVIGTGGSTPDHTYSVTAIVSD